MSQLDASPEWDNQDELLRLIGMSRAIVAARARLAPGWVSEDRIAPLVDRAHIAPTELGIKLGDLAEALDAVFVLAMRLPDGSLDVQ